VCAGKQGVLDVLSEPSPAELLRWLAHLRPGGGLSLTAAAREATQRLGPGRTAVVAFPTWSWNDGVALGAAFLDLGSGGRRPVAVVVDAGPEGAVLSSTALEALIGAAWERCAAVFKVTAGLDLGECLSEPVAVGP
jgi:hypothetical protein